MRLKLPPHPVVMRGLHPRIHPFRKMSFVERWIAGSSPTMTIFGIGDLA
jgi:hypothetical protein